MAPLVPNHIMCMFYFCDFVGLVGKDIVFRFIIEYSSLMDIGP